MSFLSKKGIRKVAFLLASIITLNIMSSVLVFDAYATDDNQGILIASSTVTPTIYVDDAKSDIAVTRAVNDLKADINRVTNADVQSNIVHTVDALNNASGTKIIVGTLGSSEVIDKMVADGKISQTLLNNLQGAGKWNETRKWEASIRTIVDGQIVIIGSDPRGTIYGIYDLSEDIGVSPWYFWADVPTEKKDSIYIEQTDHVRNEPDVQYRGVFINDEINLWRWSHSIDTEGINPGKNTYALICELLLRLNLNIMRPAMHRYSTEFVHDADTGEFSNLKVADEYGIVISSAQQMMRSTNQEWADFVNEWAKNNNGYKPTYDYSVVANREALLYWWESRVKELKDYEICWKVGMRGNNDGPMNLAGYNADKNPGETQAQYKARIVLEVIELQVGLIEAHVGTEYFSKFPMYKEVLDVYNQADGILKKGLAENEALKDIAIMWSEDNHGNIRDFPDAGEQARDGSNSLYYHLSYWGGPKSYLWLYTTPLSKVNSELDRAYENGIDRAWIMNVGDIKPAELALEYTADKAWDIDGHAAGEEKAYIENWAKQNFGDANSSDIAQIIETSYQLASARRPEFLQKNIFDQTSYGDEWTKRMKDYEDLFIQTNELYEKNYKDTSMDDAFYQLVVYPIRGAYYANSKWYYTDLYELYKAQGRGEATNFAAAMAKESQNNEYAETEYYNNTMSNGKWKNIMNPYTRDSHEITNPSSENPPSAPRIPVMSNIALSSSNMGIVAEGYELPTPQQQLNFNSITQNAKFIDVYSTGSDMINWQATASADWIKLSQTTGDTLNSRIWVTIDWEQTPKLENSANITFKNTKTNEEIIIDINADNTQNRTDFTGYVEADGYVSIEAENFDNNTSNSDYDWITYSSLGRSGASMMTYPVTLDNRITTDIASKSPALEYNINFNTVGTFDITFYRTPTLDGTGVRLAYSLNDGEPVILAGDNTVGGTWEKSVIEGIEKLTGKITIPSADAHTLKVYMVDPGVSFDQIVIETMQGANSSYYAPPQSYHSTKNTTPGQKPTSLVLGFDETQLVLDQANELLATKNVGNNIGQYSQEKHSALATAITAFENTINDTNSNDEQISTARQALATAMNEFAASRKMEDDSYVYYLYEDFDWRKQSNNLTGIDSTGSNIIEDSGNSENAVYSSKSNTNFIFDEALTDKFMVEFDFQINSNSYTLMPFVFNGPPIDGVHIVGPAIYTQNGQLRFRENGKSDTIASTPMVADTWYAAKMEVDLKTWTYTYYINGEAQVENFNFRKHPGNDSVYITDVTHISFGGNSSGQYLLDDVKVYAAKNTTNVPVQSISVSPTEFAFTSKGETQTLVPTVLPENATNKKATYISSDENVATVDENGVVTAVSNGSATITVTSQSDANIKATCAITVNIESNETVLAAKNLLDTVTIGDAVGQYSNAAANTLRLAIENAENIINSQNASQEEKNAAEENLKTSITAFRNAKNLVDSTGEYLIYEDFELCENSNELSYLTANKANILSGSDNSVLHSKGDTVWSIAPQTETFTLEFDVKLANDKWYNMPYMFETHTADGKPGPVAYIENGQLGFIDNGIGKEMAKDVTINQGQWYTIKVVVNPATYSYDYYLDGVLIKGNFKFRKHPDANDGKLIENGIACISLGGTAAGIEFELDNIKVYKPSAPVTALTISPNAKTLTSIGESFTLTASISPDNASDKTVLYKSSNESIATVDDNGVVTAVANGEATITATSKITPSISDTCTITVATESEEKYTISGKITDNVTAQGIAATVTLKKGNAALKTTTANADGTYTFNDIENGEYTITAELAQYTTATSESFVLNNSNNTVNVALSPIPAVYRTVTFSPGAGTGAMTSVSVKDNTEFSLPKSTFTPPEGKQFSAWQIGENQYSENKGVLITGDITVTALYIPIPVSITGISFNPSAVNMMLGTSTTLTATVSGTGAFDNGVVYSLTGNKVATTTIDETTGLLTVDASETATTLTVTATSRADVTKTAAAIVTLQDEPVQLFALTVTNGTGTGTYQQGATITITADEAQVGKTFTNWSTANGGTFGDENLAATTFIMPANAVTIAANYADSVYTITPSVTGSNGAISPNIVQNVTHGGEQTFTITPNNNYEIDTLKIDGNYVQPQSSYTFTNVKTSHTIDVTFKEIPVQKYNVSVNLSGGTITANGSGSYAGGELVTINAGTRTDYTFSGWQVTSGNANLANAQSANTTFIMPSSHVSLTATWQRVITPTPTPTTPAPTPTPTTPAPVVTQATVPTQNDDTQGDREQEADNEQEVNSEQETNSTAQEQQPTTVTIEDTALPKAGIIDNSVIVITPPIINGANSVLSEISINGEVLDQNDYTLNQDGSIELSEKHLEMLANGEHSVKLKYGNEVFEVKIIMDSGVPTSMGEFAEVEAQMQNSNDIVLIVMAAIAIILLAVISIIIIKRKKAVA